MMEGMKALIVYLNTYCNLPNQKVIELLGFLSDEQIKMCTGTVGNTVKSFSKKSKDIRKSLKNQILKEPVINEDETPISVNGKNNEYNRSIHKRNRFFRCFCQ